ncbi:CynX/NimT family MFS transporter [Paenibacillus pinihumi]|uniref:CynX/NimT family MFS transporter n=1 Tax=Paenibacillus pinihumi TaxID=669462 RepID=UPI000403D70F|nr:MFS transporter [Paenibacillus pinihumi]
MSTSNQDRSQPKSNFQGRTLTPWLLLTGIIFIAATMRAPLTSVGPLIGLIRETMHISNTLAGLITTLPLFAFAIFSPFVPALGRKYGIEQVMFASIILLTTGIVIRSLSGAIGLFAGTAILGLAIAVSNVLLPGLIKREFPHKLGMMTGIYSISMNLCGAIASGISVPMAVGLGMGWSGALAVWGIMSLIAVLLWLPQVKRRENRTSATVHAARDKVNLWRSPLAWQVTFFMGLQSTLFYVTAAWLPDILAEQGISADQSGWLLSILQLALLPLTFIVPIIAGRMSSQRPLVVLSFLFVVSAILGLLYGSAGAIVIWIILLGIGIGFAFGLALMFFGLRTRNAQEAAELSGMAQSCGYLLAGTGPVLFGFLHDVTHSWSTPLYVLLGAAILLLIFGLGASRNRYVGENPN